MFLGNTLANYIYAGIAFTVSICLAVVLKFVVIKNLKKLTERTENGFDDAVLTFLASKGAVFYGIVSLYVASQFLHLDAFIHKIMDAVLVVLVVYQVIGAINVFLEFFLEKRVKEANGANMTHIKDILQVVITFGFWTFGLLFIFSNLGINITSLVAGLGIGGIAIALAVQSILGDLFSYFAIYFDKPFTRGDLVIVGQHTGVIEKIGIKTTRIRALQGEEIVISNSELTSSRIQNFKKLQERRVLFNIGVTYETETEKLEQVPHIVENIVTGIECTRFDRAHLFHFGDSAYVYEIVYFVLSAEYKEYMDIHQRVNIGIIKAFREVGIEFAYPTRTVHVAKTA